MNPKISFKRLLISLFFTLFTGLNLSAETTASQPVQIDGTYQISNLAELRWVSETSDSWSSDFIITADIDASDTTTWNNGKGFSPIGNNSRKFSGDLVNTGAFVILNLFINRPDQAYVGLFGFTWKASINGAKLENVSIKGAYSVGSIVGHNYYRSTVAACSSTGSVIGGDKVGGLIGYNSDSPYSLSVSDSWSTCSVSGDNYVGGLIGSNSSSSVSYCYSLGSAIGNSYVGGLIGSSGYAAISTSYSQATVTGDRYVGGLLGYNYSSILNSYSTGAVVGNIGTGGFIGYNRAGSLISNYYDIEVSGQTVDTGNVSDHIGISGKSTVEMKTQITFTDWIFPYQWNLESNSYPALVNQVPGTVAVEPTQLSGSYQISNLAELRWISENQESWNSHFELIADIDASETVSWNRGNGFSPIGKSGQEFQGIFKTKNNCTISNITINNIHKDYLGFFGYTSGARIDGVKVENISVVGDSYIGGLIGYASETKITNSSSQGNIFGQDSVGGLIGLTDESRISKSYSEGKINGNGSVGGLIGNCSDTKISRSYSASIITGNNYVGGLIGVTNGWGSDKSEVNDSYGEGMVNGNSSVGGLVGRLGGDVIWNSYSRSAVTGNSSVGGFVGSNSGGSVFGSYSSGQVTGASSTGGFIGSYSFSISVGDNYYDQEASGLLNNSGGAVSNLIGISGKTTAEMQNQSTFISWDFSYKWTVNANKYPRFSTQTLGTVGSEPVQINDVYQISNLAELRWMSEYKESWNDNFELTADIDAADTVNWNLGDGFSPIVLFTGQFSNPGGYVIFNLVIKRPYENMVGFFSAIENATINDLNLASVSFIGGDNVGGLVGYAVSSRISDSSTTGRVSGNNSIGGLVGYGGQMEVFNSYSTVNVTGFENIGGLIGESYDSSVSAAYSTGRVRGDKGVGGLIGLLSSHYSSLVINSYSTGRVSGDSDVGGLVGINEGEISKSYSTGDVSGEYSIGGLVGSNSHAEILFSYSRSHVLLTRTVGGLIRGLSGGLVGYNYSSLIANSYSTGSVRRGYWESENVGGFIGKSSGSSTLKDNFFDVETSGFTDDSGYEADLVGVLGKTTTEMQTPSTFEKWDLMYKWVLETNCYPTFATLVSGIESREPVKINEVYQIGTLAELRWMSEHPESLNSDFELTADIDATETVSWDFGAGFSPIKGLTGDFNNSGGFVISNLSIRRPYQDSIGLLTSVSSSIVDGLKLENASIVGRNVVGGLIGSQNNSMITGSYCTGKVSGNNSVGGLVGSQSSSSNVLNSYSSATVRGGDKVGGLVGYTRSSIVSNSYSIGSVNGRYNVGGLIGYSFYDVISNVYSRGTVIGINNMGGLVGYTRGSIISNSYSAGAVRGSENQGGLVGYIDSYSLGNFNDIFFDVESTGLIDAAGNMIGLEGVTGLTSELMISQDSFTNWDFDSIWNTSDSYPVLQWQLPIYNVKFDMNGGRLNFGELSQQVTHGNSVIPPLLDSPVGYDFDRWSISVIAITESVTIRAQYIPKIYKVTFVVGYHGISSDDLTQDIMYTQSAISPKVHGNPGWQFVGWNKPYTNITGDTVLYANYQRVVDGGILDDYLTEVDERFISVAPNEEYLIDTILIDGISRSLANRELYESGAIDINAEVEVSYVKRIESVCVYKGKDSGLEIGDGLTTKIKDKYYLIMSFDQYGDLYKSKLIKYGIDSLSKLKQMTEVELNLQAMDVVGKTDWKVFSQLDKVVSMISGKSKLLNLGLNEEGERIQKDVISSLKGSLLFAEAESFKTLKRSWVLDKAITKDANTFLPRKISKLDTTSLPDFDDVINYLLNEKLISYELLVD